MAADTRLLDLQTAQEFRGLLDGYPFPPMGDIRAIRRESILSLQWREFEETLRNPDSVVLGRWKRNRPAGVVAVRKLGFDTEFFGFPCYSISTFVVSSPNDASTRHELVRAALGELENREAVFVFARPSTLESAHLTALQRNGFRYVDTTVRYVFDMGAGPPKFEPTVTLREAKPGDAEALAEIAATYSENRFHYDARFPRDRADELYRVWIRNSLRGEADWIVVAELDGKPVGFTTNKDHPELPTEGGRFAGEMVFSAVSAEARGRDVYTSMIHAGLVHFDGRADAVYLGGLVNNIAVQRAWQRLGFRISSASNGFHRWLRKS